MTAATQKRTWDVEGCALQLSTFPLLLIAITCQTTAPLAASGLEPSYFYASQTGRTTLDVGEGGGNPFASALVELLARDRLTFGEFRRELVGLTKLRSRGLQEPEVPTSGNLDAWRIQPIPTTETRVALVLVFSDYSSSVTRSSLPGAHRDMHRVADALQSAGFDVTTVIDPDRAEVKSALKRFGDLSATSEIAVVYTTGHGVEVQGAVYLLPGDYSHSLGSANLEERAVRLTSIGSVLRASRANLVFYGGCRTNFVGSE